MDRSPLSRLLRASGIASSERAARLRNLLRRGRHASIDALERLIRGADPLLPPSRLMFVGGTRRDFRPLGEKWLRTFITVGKLSPGDRVLDVGCGVGRMAVPLARYLDARSSYDGFDIVRDGIDWCRQAIGSRFPHFTFQHADVHNDLYNPNGCIKASQYRFPYADASFDFVFATSVFTHMMRDGVRQYLSETARVLKPGGRCLVTFFVLDETARRCIRTGVTPAARRFSHPHGDSWIVDPASPEAAVAYDEALVRELYRDARLEIQGPVRFGGWSRREDPVTPHSQDIVLATK